MIIRNGRSYSSVCTRGGCLAGHALSTVKKGAAVADPGMSQISFLVLNIIVNFVITYDMSMKIISGKGFENDPLIPKLVLKVGNS